MNAARTEHLRARILALHDRGLAPAAIVAELGCARSTVYKALRDGPAAARDRRRTATTLTAVAAVRALAHDDRAFGPSEIAAVLADAQPGQPTPSVSTIARILRSVRPPADPDAEHAEPAFPPAPPRDPLLPAYAEAAAARVHRMDLRPEGALLLALLREAVADLDRPGGDPRARPRLREHAAALVLQLLRASLLVDNCFAEIPYELVDPQGAAEANKRVEEIVARVWSPS